MPIVFKGKGERQGMDLVAEVKWSRGDSGEKTLMRIHLMKKIQLKIPICHRKIFEQNETFKI